MIDEKYLQKSAQCQSEEYVGVDKKEICSKELLHLW